MDVFLLPSFCALLSVFAQVRSIFDLEGRAMQGSSKTCGKISAQNKISPLWHNILDMIRL